MKKSLIFIFLDGFGLGKSDEFNPLFTCGLPALESFIGAKLVENCHVRKDTILVKGVDATLGVNGIPQSATGQTSLLTGINAPLLLGYHLPAFPDEALINVIRQKSILKQITNRHMKATFLNAYSDNYFEKVQKGEKAESVTTHCVHAANLPFRSVKDLQSGNAVYWDITGEHLQSLYEVQKIKPSEAAYNCCKVSRSFDLTLFECFATDIIGHSCSMEKAEEILKILDEFINNIIINKDPMATVLICSDHGNIEDLSVGSHTINLVPLIVIGPLAFKFFDIDRIDQITPRILEVM